jgi:CRP/FNR family transcriptional regulator
MQPTSVPSRTQAAPGHASTIRAPGVRKAEREGVRCSNCAMRAVCMPEGLSEQELAELDRIVCQRRRVARAQALYRTGDAFANLYAIRTGSFKTVVTHRDGREQVTGFAIAGEPLGLDGISADRQTCDAVALEDSVVCVIPFAQLERLCRDSGTVQRHVHRMMSHEIVRESALMLLLGNMRADERVASFLTGLARRYAMRGYSGSELQLRMTRDEIGSYLGMKLETVSRTLSRLQKEALIETRGKWVRIVDGARLRQI